ncbi:MAG: 16S rRNA (adenine(1518)-N(6)/adenine(1519)-N(6))-dimethyltransferase RsmA [Planctomycetota bacterium]
MASPGARGRRMQHLQTRFAEYGIRPNRRLGQNFLLDRNAVLAICRDAEVFALDTVLEIGPGSGLLTTALAATGAAVLSVEIDRALAALVRNETAAHPNVEIREGDILAGKHALDPAVLDRIAAIHADRPGGSLLCVSNLPYCIASPFVANLCQNGLPWARAVFLVQREEAERFAADPGTGQYGSLSVVSQLAADEVRVLRSMPPTVFWPRPRVQSSVVRLRFRSPEIRTAVPWRALRRVTSAIFAARRKKLRNALAALYPKGESGAADALLARAGFSPDRRGETLSPDELVSLAETAVETGVLPPDDDEA